MIRPRFGHWRRRAIALGALIGAIAGATRVAAADELTPERRAAHVASFDKVWETIRDRQWDPAFDQQAWAASRDELRPAVEQAQSDAEARAVLESLLARLGQSHFGIIPQESYTELEAGEGGVGEIGATIRLRDGALMVMRVRDGSPAARAGVQPGWTLQSVDGRSLDGLIEAARDAEGVQRAETTCALVAEARLSGPPGEPVEVVLLDHDGVEQTLTIVRDEAPGTPARFGNLPEMWVAVDARTIEGGVGYFGLNIFFDPPRVLQAWEEWLLSHLDAPGIVIDLRGNLGGIGAMAMAMGGWLIDEPNLYLGTMHLKGSSLRFVLNPRLESYGGPVAVLIDEVSISNAELLSGGLKDIGRARIFGERTAGLVLLSTVERLPNGDGFQYAFAGYESASGKPIEGVGVEPDERILETAASLRSGADPVLDAALAWIASQRK